MALPSVNLFFPEAFHIEDPNEASVLRLSWPNPNAIVNVDISSDGGESFLRALDENGTDSWSYESNAATGAYTVVLEGLSYLFPPDGTYLVHLSDSGGNSGLVVVNSSESTLAITPPANTDLIPEVGLFTSKREMELVFSAEGVQNHREDWTENDDVINYVIEQATEEALQFLRGKFSQEAMVSSRWVRIKCTYIACHLLSIRQGNHSLYGDQFDKALNDLMDARDGLLNTGMPTFLPAIVQTPMHDARFLKEGRINPLQSSEIYAGQSLAYTGRGLSY